MSARAGQTVVAQGGDPYLFGRGGEEAEALHEPASILKWSWRYSPSGIAAYTGVPLTHRERPSVVTFVTGHHAGVVDSRASAPKHWSS